MKFYHKNIKLINKRQFTSNAGKLCSLVKIIDESDYDVGEFFVNSDCDFDGLIVQNNYDAILDVEGKNSSVNLVSFSK